MYKSDSNTCSRNVPLSICCSLVKLLSMPFNSLFFDGICLHDGTSPKDEAQWKNSNRSSIVHWVVTVDVVEFVVVVVFPFFFNFSVESPTRFKLDFPPLISHAIWCLSAINIQTSLPTFETVYYAKIHVPSKKTEEYCVAKSIWISCVYMVMDICEPAHEHEISIK